MKKAIIKRQETNKELLIDQLKKTPIIQVSCEKVGIGRATFYRWRKDDSEFAQRADEAIAEGSYLINDLAESQLISSIKNSNLGAIVFWLKHHHPNYATRIEVTTNQRIEALTEEQQEVVTKALTLTGLIGKEDKEKQND
jgi:ACT domain-containing protein